MFYVYKNDNDLFLPFFKSMNYVAVKEIPQKIALQTNIYYSLDTYELLDSSNHMINILVINDSIIDVQNIRGFNYYLPLTPNLYFKYINDFGLKLLLPINIFKETNWNKYFIDSNLNKYTKNIKGVCSTVNDSNIIIINNNTRSLDATKMAKDKKIFNLDIKRSKYDLFNINNYLSLCNTCCNNLDKPPKAGFEIKLILLNDLFEKKLDLKANQYYIISRSGFKCIQDNYSLKMFFNYNFDVVSFLCTNGVTNEIVLFVHPQKNISKSFVELFENIQYSDHRIIGTNTNVLNDDDNYRLHYYYSKYKLYHMLEYMIEYESYYYDIIIKYICDINCCFKKRFDV